MLTKIRQYIPQAEVVYTKDGSRVIQPAVFNWETFNNGLDLLVLEFTYDRKAEKGFRLFAKALFNFPNDSGAFWTIYNRKAFTNGFRFLLNDERVSDFFWYNWLLFSRMVWRMPNHNRVVNF